MARKGQNVLVLGAGGREHALCWKLRQSPHCGALYCSPGNAGIAQSARCVSLPNRRAQLAFCRAHDIALVVPGAEAMLLDGAVDALRAAGFAAFGPTRAAAQLEGSKSFTKNLCAAENIPTARFRCFDARAPAQAWAQTQPLPLVVKADGLAAGKGVMIAATRAQLRQAIDAMFDGRFGAAGQKIVLEECLRGTEMSFFALCDGRRAYPFASAQDYKRIGDGDTGPNTGGMGAVSPSPLATPALERRIMRRIIQPTLAAMVRRGAPFQGLLYAGLMIAEGEPKLIEYNVRFGDPECQAMLPRLQSDLLPVLMACAKGQGVRAGALRWSAKPSLLVVVASRGYPGAVAAGGEIRNLSALEARLTALFHAATKRVNGQWHAAGGRVLNLVMQEKTLQAARQSAYTALEELEWAQAYYRKDIGAGL